MTIDTRRDLRPWDGFGTTVTESMTSADLLKAANLDWTISKEPLYFMDAEGGTHKFEGNYGLIRDSDHKEIGVCGKDYRPTQNARAFEFFEKFIEKGQMRMEAAGSFRGTKGLHVWALASLQQEFVLPGDDVVRAYVLLSHPHIWGQTLQIKPTAMRIYCYNSLMAALRAGEECFKHWHTREFDDDAIDKARLVVAATTRLMEEVKQKAEFLSRKSTSVPSLAKYVARLFQPALLVDESRRESSGAVTTKLDPIFFNKTAFTVWDSVFKSPGAEATAAEGTWWGAFNGVTYAIDHKIGRNRETALCEAWLGGKATLKLRALDLAVDYAERS